MYKKLCFVSELKVGDVFDHYSLPDLYQRRYPRMKGFLATYRMIRMREDGNLIEVENVQGQGCKGFHKSVFHYVVAILDDAEVGKLKKIGRSA